MSIQTLETSLKKISNTFDRDLISFVYQKITIGASALSLTVPAEAKCAVCIVESTTTSGIVARILQNMSTLVASGTGLPVKDGTEFTITSISNLNGFQIIKELAGTSYLNVEYFK